MKQLARNGPIHFIVAVVAVHAGIMWWARIPPTVAVASMTAGYLLAAAWITVWMRVPVLRRWVGIPDCRRVGCTGPGLGAVAMCPRHQAEQVAS